MRLISKANETIFLGVCLLGVLVGLVLYCWEPVTQRRPSSPTRTDSQQQQQNAPKVNKYVPSSRVV